MPRHLLAFLCVVAFAACSSLPPERTCEPSCHGLSCGSDGCGGSCGTCAADATCQAGQCTPNHTCSDNQKNGDESDVDCGGSCPTCLDGKRCSAAADCASSRCDVGVCASCEDDRRSGAESDVDCGHVCQRRCGNGKSCDVNADCVSNRCEGGTCVAQPTCSDHQKNGNESDVDCGGACTACATGKTCGVGRDCATGICTGGICRDPSCTDNLKNQDESDVDCGGSCSRKCDAAQLCKRDSDCVSSSCVSGHCAACLNRCPQAGASRCVGDGVETCLADAHGCLDWSATTSCGSGRICDPDTNACADAGCGDVPVEGRCLGTSTIEYCSAPTGGGTAFVRRLACGTDESCSVVSGRATCVLTAACRNGETRCATANQLETCVSGQWSSTTCPSGCNGENPLTAFCESGNTRTISGTVSYEYRPPNANRTDWGPLATAVAPGFLVMSFAATGTGSPEAIDAAYTDGQGAYSVKVPLQPGPNDFVAVAAIGVNKQGGIRYVVADPGFADAGVQPPGAMGSEPHVWSWAWKTQSLPAANAFLIHETDGSGAARVFDYLRYVYAYTDAKFAGKTGLPVSVWVGMNTTWTCGACFDASPNSAFKTQFQSAIYLPGGANQEYWADSVTAHELGHWVMASFGTSPDEGGKHVLGNPTFPGQAWSEGWATWFSSNVRRSSFYVDKQQYGMFWADLAARTYSRSVPWQRPVPAGGLLQKMDENEVSALLWSLSNTSALAPNDLFAALSAPQMNTSPFGRGYTRHTWDLDSSYHFTNVADTGVSRPCLADFLDALDCRGFSRQSIDAATEPTTAYPYPSATPICRDACSAASCAGCCINGACVAGNTTMACGANGNACVACNTGQSCTNGACVGGTCDASTCPNGCCSGTTCVTPTSASFCGSGGAICRTCAAGQVCSGGSCMPGEDAICTASSVCAPNLLCVAEDQTSGTCHRSCTPGSSTCGTGYNCATLQNNVGACLPAPSSTSRWHIGFLQASIRSTDPSDGSAWDSDNSAPDPYVCVTVAGSPAACSSYLSDTLTPQWNELSTADFPYSALGSVTVELWDSDLFANDRIDSYTINLRSPWANHAWVFAGDHRTTPTAGSEFVLLDAEPVP